MGKHLLDHIANFFKCRVQKNFHIVLVFIVVIAL